MDEGRGLTPGGQEALLERQKCAPKVRIGQYELNFEPDVPDQVFLEKATNELRETAEVVDQALRDIRILLQDEPDLIVPDDDEYYQKFLRPCKWYPQSALTLMKHFYRFRISYPHVSRNLLPSNLKTVFLSGVVTPLPLRGADGCRILYILGGKHWKPKEVPLDDLLKATMLSLDAAMAEPKTQIAGVRVILNMDGLSLGQVTYFTPSFAAMVMEWIQRCLPCRLKGIHVVNQPLVFNMVFALFKPFFQEKFRKRMYFHGTDRQALFKHIHQKSVPKQLGGELDFPDEPVGEPLWRYFCAFEEDFKVSNDYGYVGKS